MPFISSKMIIQCGFWLNLNISVLLDRCYHLGQLGAIDQGNRIRFGELSGFRCEVAVCDHDPVLYALGRHHAVKLAHDPNTNAPRLSALALHKNHLAVLSQTKIDTAVRPIFDVVQHQKTFAPEGLADKAFELTPTQFAHRIQAGLPLKQPPLAELKKTPTPPPRSIRPY